MHTPDWQSPGAAHAFPFLHRGQVAPPQSVSDSPPFVVWSSQRGGLGGETLVSEPHESEVQTIAIENASRAPIVPLCAQGHHDHKGFDQAPVVFEVRPRPTSHDGNTCESAWGASSRSTVLRAGGETPSQC